MASYLLDEQTPTFLDAIIQVFFSQPILTANGELAASSACSQLADADKDWRRCAALGKN